MMIKNNKITLRKWKWNISDYSSSFCMWETEKVEEKKNEEIEQKKPRLTYVNTEI